MRENAGISAAGNKNFAVGKKKGGTIHILPDVILLRRDRYD
jgi:hypothetical protein